MRHAHIHVVHRDQNELPVTKKNRRIEQGREEGAEYMFERILIFCN